MSDELLDNFSVFKAEYDRNKIMTNPRTRGYHCELARGTYRSYDWYVAYNNLGFRTGYIKVRKGHPWFGVSYDDIDVEVHGGLTYSEKGPPGKIPKFSYGWWLGFDCGHAYDAPDIELIPAPTRLMWGRIKQETEGRVDVLDVLSRDNIVRTQEYVESECIELCKQAIEVAKQ